MSKPPGPKDPNSGGRRRVSQPQPKAEAEMLPESIQFVNRKIPRVYLQKAFGVKER
ncbi:MAG: hypothetical protein ABH950_07855 [Candidatus Altiarchaeota archaeon]